ncbi:pyruvate kinase [Ruegeria marina]|uniref:Pyruvate kinase n=1 Tax=Ruegeria marina TaxID=639004 RepID=A0A1G6ZJT9_9RHOB|nr:pyruvate kinase [Ruegeria marina]SDE02919.1 pyruvate kinase [Ruegeria marina]
MTPNRTNTKILATLGPASRDKDVIRALFERGANVFRLNMSHGDHETIAKTHATIREIETELGRPIGILADLQGPKIRCGTFEAGTYILQPGDTFTFDDNPAPGNSERVQLPHPEILAALNVGSTVLVNDGKLRLEVRACSETSATCEVLVGGQISDRKGVNLPDVLLPLSALSDKDRLDLEFVCELGIDWLALSFVQKASDIAEAASLVKGRARIIAKIEKPLAVENFDAILATADGIMIARGDLGVELPVHQVPRVQRSLVARARAAGKPVVVATQMLESMIDAPVPTRAEVSDVATAIYDGADAVMLSAETAAGAFPREAVSVMSAVARETEADPKYAALMKEREPDLAEIDTSHAIAAAAREISDRARISAICCFTQSGTTAFLVAREKPSKPVLALTPSVQTARQLCLVWGLQSVVVPQATRFKEAGQFACAQCLTHGVARKGDEIVFTAGVPIEDAGTTNILRVWRV